MTILTAIHDGFFVRNFLRTDAARIIIEQPGDRLVVLVPKEKVEYYALEFPESSITFDVLPELQRPVVETFFQFIERASIHSRTARMQRTYLFQSNFSFSWNGIRTLLLYPVEVMCGCLGQFSWWRRMIRWSYARFSDHTFDSLLDRYNPDVVYCSNVIHSEDHILAKVARRRGVRVVGMILSWDNLYSKTIIRVHPDTLLVHTPEILELAATYGDFPRNRVCITGIPQYDRYFSGRVTMSREEFLNSIGADPSKKTILYAFSGKAALDIEFDILRILHESLEAHALSESVNVLIRPYPRYDFSEKRMERMRSAYRFFVVSAVGHVADTVHNWEFTDEAVNFLHHSLIYADVVVTMYSTFFIEAAILDKPIVGVAFDGALRRPYWNSARRFFDWNHLAKIRTLNGIAIVHSADEMVTALNDALQVPAMLREGRARIVQEQCYMTDGKSAERVARAIIHTL
ncbi:MAG: CDP-glycerol glycerophosphotransferase family protein [Patescibacteria group bacterium]